MVPMLIAFITTEHVVLVHKIAKFGYIDHIYIVLSSLHSAYDHAFLLHWHVAASAHIDMPNCHLAL